MLDLSLRSMAGKKGRAACGTEVERALESRLERLRYDPDERATRSGMNLSPPSSLRYDPDERQRFEKATRDARFEKHRRMLEASNLSLSLIHI